MARTSGDSVSKRLLLVAALAVALASGTALARGGGGGGGGRGTGGRSHGHFQSGGSDDEEDDFEILPVIGSTLYGRRAHGAAGSVLSEETVPRPMRMPFSGPGHEHGSANQVDSSSAPAPSAPDIYVYKDGRGVVHFTDYEPLNGKGRVYIRGEAPLPSRVERSTFVEYPRGAVGDRSPNRGTWLRRRGG